MFACCENLAAGDKNLDYDCKTSLPGGGTCTDEASCKENYIKGVEVLEAAAVKAPVDKGSSTLKNIMSVCIPMLLVLGIFALILYRVK